MLDGQESTTGAITREVEAGARGEGGGREGTTFLYASIEIPRSADQPSACIPKALKATYVVQHFPDQMHVNPPDVTAMLPHFTSPLERRVRG